MNETKTCATCSEDKSIEEFSWHYKERNIRHGVCRSCVNIRSKQWYENNKQTHIKTTVAATKRRRDSIRQQLATLNLACTKCGENHLAVIEFHHTDPSTKEANVSDLVGRGASIEQVLEEMKKCIVLCSNCHRKVHWELRL